MDEHYIYDADSWCLACLPVPCTNPEVADGDGEQDTPANCNRCGRPLKYSLTQEGMAYVLDAVMESLRDQEWELIDEEVESYYKGMPNCVVVRDWVTNLVKNYGLSRTSRALCDGFLIITKPYIRQAVKVAV